MALSVTGWISDSQTTAVEGLNRARDPDLISEHQLAGARNVSIRGGRAHSRPRIVRRCSLPIGRLQGGSVFSAAAKVLVSVGGKILEVDPHTWDTPSELTGTGDDAATQDDNRNNPTQPRAWFCETVGSMVIQDGQAKPWLYDGVEFRRAEDDEVPVGTAMAFSNGRLAVAIGLGRVIRIGDIRTTDRQSELKFTEYKNLLGGGDFLVPSPCTAMAALPVLDTGSGQGALIVSTRDQLYSFKTNITQRDLWSEIGFQTLLLPTRGCVGAGAMVAVNQDLYFRSSDGLRSVRTSAGDLSSPGLTPLSAEVRHRFERDTQSLLADTSVVLFDNRIICTHSPFVYTNRSLSAGLVSYNLDALSSRGQKMAPVWDGDWDGVLAAQVFCGTVAGIDRCFILGRDDTGNALWEVLPEVSVEDGDEPTQAVETRVLFGDAPASLKRFRRVDLWISDIGPSATLRAYFRPDKFSGWVLLQEWALAGGYRSRLSTAEPDDSVNNQTMWPVNLGFGFQVRLEWTGKLKVDQVTAYFEPVAEGNFVDQIDSFTAQNVPGVQASWWHRHTVSPHQWSGVSAAEDIAPGTIVSSLIDFFPFTNMSSRILTSIDELKAVATKSVAVPVWYAVRLNDQAAIFELRTHVAQEAVGDAIFFPNDYNSSTNRKVFVRIL